MSNQNSFSDSPSPGSLAGSLDSVFGDEGQDPEASPATAFLVGLSGKHAGKLFRIPVGESLIGRTSKALVCLDEKAVSHRHARLHLTAESCTITDLESTNGSFLNDGRLSETRELRAGDVMRFGTSTLGFLTDAQDEDQHTRALARITRPTFVNLDPGPARAPSQSSHPGIVPVSRAPLDTLAPSPVQSMALGTAAHNPLDSALDKLELALSFLRGNWKIVLACSLIFGAIGAASLRFAPPVTTAEFEIFLRQEQTQKGTRYFATRDVEYFASAEQNFTNLELVRETMEDMKMSTGGNAVLGTSKALAFARAKGRMFLGSYTHLNRDFSERFLAQHLKNFLEWEIGKSIRVIASEVDLLRTQFNDNETQLKEEEQKLRRFKEEHVDALPEQARAQIGSRASLIIQKDALSASLARASQQLKIAQKDLKNSATLTVTKASKAAAYDASLVEVRRAIAAAKARGLAEQHPEIVKKRAEEANLLKLKEIERAREVKDSDREVDFEHRSLKSRVAELQVLVSTTGQELGQVEKRLNEAADVAGRLPEVEIKLEELMRNAAASKRLHDKLYEQLKAKELELQFERASVEARYEVSKPPTAFALKPKQIAAKRAVILALVGAMFGVGIALILWLRSYARERRVRLDSQTAIEIVA